MLRSFFKPLLRNSNTNRSRAFLNLCAPSKFPVPIPSPSPSPVISSSSLLSPFRLTSFSHSHLLSPLSSLIPFSSPLFLSSPPWQLLQCTTPLYLQGEGNVVLRRLTGTKVDLGFGSLSLVNGFDDQTKESLRNGVGVGSGGCGEIFFNLPNSISMSRLISGPFIGCGRISFNVRDGEQGRNLMVEYYTMIMNEWYLSAFIGLAVSGATDWLDGYVARRMGINSVIGSYLDPLADKVLIVSVAIAMVKKGLLQPWLVGLVVLRDVGLISGAVYQRANSLDWEWKSWSEFTNLDGTRARKVEPLFLSKVNTVFQLVLVAAALLQPEFGTDETQVYITYLSWLVASTTVASTVAYGAQQMRSGSTLVAKQKFPSSKSS